MGGSTVFEILSSHKYLRVVLFFGKQSVSYSSFGFTLLEDDNTLVVLPDDTGKLEYINCSKITKIQF